MFNREATFNKVVAALIAQGVPSKNDIGYCAYRGSNGHKCAIGHLIPDENYDPTFEDLAIQSTYLADEAKQILLAAGIPIEEAAFASMLQELHDWELDYSLERFISEAKHIAAENGWEWIHNDA